MDTYRSKPFTIKATRFTRDAIKGVDIVAITPDGYQIKGKQGYVNINDGDYVIAEPDGSGHYPCAPDVFEAKYERVTVLPAEDGKAAATVIDETRRS